MIFNIDKKYLLYSVELDEEYLYFAEYEIQKSEKNLSFDENSIPFSKGEKVRHKVFEIGEIIEIDTQKKVYVIKFENSKIRHIMFDTPLEKLNNK